MNVTERNVSQEAQAIQRRLVEQVIIDAAAGVIQRRRRRRRVSALIVAGTSVAVLGIGAMVEANDPDNCRIVGTEPASDGRGVRDAVVRTERGLSLAEVARSVDESLKLNPAVIGKSAPVTIVHCTVGPQRPGSFVGKNPIQQ